MSLLYTCIELHHLYCDRETISVGQYNIFTSGIQYYKLRTVFGIPQYLIKQVDEPFSVNG